MMDHKTGQTIDACSLDAGAVTDTACGEWQPGDGTLSCECHSLEKKEKIYHDSGRD